MTILDEFTASKSELARDIKTAQDAELEDAPMQNGKKRNVDTSKNTHFEFQYGGNDAPEVYVYIERYDAETGIEVMLWADQDWFDSDPADYGTTPADGMNPLGEFAPTLLTFVTNTLDAATTPSFQSHQNARPSVVFSAVYYL